MWSPLKAEAFCRYDRPLTAISSHAEHLFIDMLVSALVFKVFF